MRGKQLSICRLIQLLFFVYFRVAVQTEEFSTLYLGDLEGGQLPAAHDCCGSIEGKIGVQFLTVGEGWYLSRLDTKYM
jgi:hypothetical protein